MVFVRYIQNWGGKLDQEEFTTIRSWAYEKERFYRNSVGYKFAHLVAGKKYTEAYLMEVSVKNFNEIPPSVLIKDTGLMDMEKIIETFKAFGIEKDSPCLVLKFSKRGSQ